MSFFCVGGIRAANLLYALVLLQVLPSESSTRVASFDPIATAIRNKLQTAFTFTAARGYLNSALVPNLPLTGYKLLNGFTDPLIRLWDHERHYLSMQFEPVGSVYSQLWEREVTRLSISSEKFRAYLNR